MTREKNIIIFTIDQAGVYIMQNITVVVGRDGCAMATAGAKMKMKI